MIGYLEGKVQEAQGSELVILAGHVGYMVTVPNRPEYIELIEGSDAALFVYTHVREDALDLYGFKSKAEKLLFLTLLSMSGVGPKVALGFLSGMEPGTLIEAILSEDKAMLTKVPGVGKKTAERVIVELRDTLKKKMDAGIFSGFVFTGSQGPRVGPRGKLGGMRSGRTSQVTEAMAALLGLGYREVEAEQLIQRVLQETEVDPSQLKVEDLIRAALRSTGKP